MIDTKKKESNKIIQINIQEQWDPLGDRKHYSVAARNQSRS